ncbi:MAG: hypothetical protein COY42_17750 [Armatimonadetes bacterium CG_4_10_14_0_8_um_filter_66_14]|nr:hypothetical protein [Armatimonadota bacterium]PIZ42342.1 MAG: hypothetical protein COY42_17750 [Armatimonadetes bacterium CG_4_10_14_0_8_um_filter_66_14]
MTDRIAALKARVLNSRQLGDPRAGELHRESLAQTEGEPEVLRAAKAAAHYYRHQELVLNEGELIVGTQPGLTFDAKERVVPAAFGRRDFSSWGWAAGEAVEPFFREGMLSWAGNHKTLDYERVFEVGFSGLLAEIEDRLSRLAPEEDDCQQKRDFLAALKIVAEGFLDLSNRLQ